MTTYRIERARDSQDLARMAAQTIASYLDLALDQRDRAQLALSGGSTPAVAYGLLGQEHLPWERVDVFLGDERWVDGADASSNARMLRQTLLLQAPGSHAAFHPVPTVSLQTPEYSAGAFQAAIQKVCPGEPPIFDLMVLGLGEDGHTASLFPGTEAPTVTDRWTTVGRGKGLERITLTAPVLSASRQVIFLVSGAGKAQALSRLLDPAESPQRTPAKLVTPRTEVLVLADEAALAGGAAAG